MTQAHRGKSWILPGAVLLAAMSVCGLSAGTAQATGASSTHASSTGASSTHASSTAAAPAISDDPVAYAAALKSPDWVKAPDGLVNKSCVIQVPNGSAIDGDRITLPSGQVIGSGKPCAYPTLVARKAAGGDSGHGVVVPSTHGWLMHTQYDSPAWLTGISSLDTVPTAPGVSASQLNYFFSSLQSPSHAIMQAVIGWGYSGNPGSGNFYYMNSWYVWSTKHVVSSTVRISSGDRVFGSVRASSCRGDGSYCNWVITADDETTGQWTGMTITSYESWYEADGGVFESYNATGCVMLPAGGAAWFEDITVFGNGYSPITPDFFNVADDQECSMYASYGDTYTGLLWNP